MKPSSVRQFLNRASIILVVLVLALPLVFAALLAVGPIEDVYAFPARILPSNVEWTNFSDAMKRLPFIRFMLNSVVVACCAATGAVLTSAMAGYAFARLNWRRKKFCTLLLIAALVVPAQLLLIPQFLLFTNLGWVNTYKPLIVPAWLGGGAFNVYLFWQFFRTISRNYDDAAKLDGASHWTILTRILMPMSKPAVATVALLSFVYHWQDFQKPLIYLSDFQTYTMALGLRMYQVTGGGWMNLVMAASLIALIPVLVAFLILQKHIGAPKIFNHDVPKC